jgi:hypothetical protein
MENYLCYWSEVLVEDMRVAIVKLLDPLSKLMLSISSKSNSKLVGPFLPREYNLLLCQYGSKKILNEFPLDTSSSSRSMACSTKYENFDAMQWLVKHNVKLNPWDFSWPIRNGNLEHMQWLKNQNCPLSDEEFYVAAVRGNFKVLEWLKEQNCPWEPMWLGIRHDKIKDEVYEWLISHGVVKLPNR